MRFIKGVVKILVFLGSVVVVVYVLGPEIMVALAAMEFRGQVTQLKALVAKPPVGLRCQDNLGGNKVEPVSAYQIRFINESEYVIEAVCSNAATGTIVISKHKLGYGVEKLPGYSGIVWQTQSGSQSVGWIVISGWKRIWKVGVEDGNVAAVRWWGQDELPIGAPVNNSCQGWGYQCCSQVNQVGDGQQLETNVLDCPTSCFRSCLNRPVVTTLITEPYFDDNRIVALSPGQGMVDFSWKVQDQDGSIAKVVIEFGDGNSEQTTTETGTVTHRYQCSQDTCVYLVRLVAVNNRGLVSPETLNSGVKVLVRNL